MAGLRDAEVIVVGAGMAGIAAAAHLSAAGVATVVLEARDRIGGRAWTVSLPGIGPTDLGCHWFHSADRNPLVAMARGLGFTVEEYPTSWADPWLRARLGPGYDAWSRANAAFWAAAAACVAEGRDPPLAALLPAEAPDWHPMLRAIVGYAFGAAAEDVSGLDVGRYSETGVNWRSPAGQGAVVAARAAGLDIRCGAAVEAVRMTRTGVTVEIAGGGTIAASAAILAVPTALYDAIAFDPPLPEAKRAAVADLPLGCDEKVYLAVDGAPFGPPEDRQIAPFTDRAAMGHYHLHPMGRPVVEGFFGGAQARELAHAGIDAFAEQARDELAAVFGGAVRRRLRPVVATDWHGDPWSRGAYSHARPGRASAREALAAPVEGRLFFAGEACSIHSPATCHGAHETGVDAARAALAILARTVPAAPPAAGQGGAFPLGGLRPLFDFAEDQSHGRQQIAPDARR